MQHFASCMRGRHALCANHRDHRPTAALAGLSGPLSADSASTPASPSPLPARWSVSAVSPGLRTNGARGWEHNLQDGGKVSKHRYLRTLHSTHSKRQISVHWRSEL